VLHSWCLFIGFNDSSSCSFVTNGGCQTYQTLTLDNGCWLPPTTHHCSLLLWQCQEAANAAPAALFDSHKLAFFLWQWQPSFFDNGSHIIGNIPTITFFAIYVGNCPLASSVHACILQLFQVYHSENIFGQVYRYSPNLSITKVIKAHLFSHKRITTTRWSVTSHLKSVNVCHWDTKHSPSSLSSMLILEWFFKPHIKAYNTPSNGNIYFRVRQSLSEYFNVITSSPLFQESTNPGVASALCSTLGTMSYIFVSLPLLVLRVQAALHL